jgi:hypothetical protein
VRRGSPAFAMLAVSLAVSGCHPIARGELKAVISQEVGNSPQHRGHPPLAVGSEWSLDERRRWPRTIDKPSPKPSQIIAGTIATDLARISACVSSAKQ